MVTLKKLKGAGFTLLEVLITLLIFTAVMAAVYALLRGSIKGALSTQEDLALQEASQKAMGELMNEISQATVILEAGPRLLRFKDKSGEIVYAWDSGQMLRNEMSIGLGKNGAQDFEVSAATFSYFGSDSSLDKDENGEIDFLELDLDGDGEILESELSGITLIRLSVTFSRKGRKFPLQSSVNLSSLATGRR